MLLTVRLKKSPLLQCRNLPSLRHSSDAPSWNFRNNIELNFSCGITSWNCFISLGSTSRILQYPLGLITQHLSLRDRAALDGILYHILYGSRSRRKFNETGHDCTIIVVPSLLYRTSLYCNFSHRRSQHSKIKGLYIRRTNFFWWQQFCRNNYLFPVTHQNTASKWTWSVSLYLIRVD